MGIGISGITSGMDTDAIIEALVATKTAKKESLQKDQIRLQWTQDVWKELNAKIYNFYSKTLSDMRLLTTYNKKSTTVSNPNVATITASSSSVNGTQKLGIVQTAEAGYLTGAQLKSASGGKVKSDTKLSDLGITDSSSINISVGGKDSVITVDGDTTVNDFVQQLRKAGVDANFDAQNQRFFISAKKSGVDNDFSLTSAGGSGLKALQSLGLHTMDGNFEESLEWKQYQEWASKSDADIDTLIANAIAKAKHTDTATEEGILKNEINSLKTQQYQYNYAQMYAGADPMSEANIKARNDYAEALQKKMTDISQQLADGKDASGVDLTDADKEALQKELEDAELEYGAIRSVDAAIGSATMDQADRTKYINELTDVSADLQKAQDTLADPAEVQKIVDEKNKAIDDGIEKQYKDKRTEAQAFVADYNTQKEYLDKKAAGTNTPADDQAYADAVNRIGDITASSNTDGKGAVRVAGKNAIIELNGARFESAENTMTVNGLTITAQEVTGYTTDKDGNEVLNTVSITTKTDTEGIYNMIKNFFKEYNSLINEMDKLYNSESTRGYDPLTDQEKEAMTDKEAEKYEQKIKDSLLRRDSTLGGISQMMKNIMAGGADVDGKKSYLSDFGIKTLGYLYAAANERGAYHIDGDKDDSTTSGKADKLMAALLEDPDSVAKTMSGIATKLYDSLYDKMRTTTMSSIYTVYNDKQMKEEYNNYTKKIKEQEDKVAWWEDYYRSKFTAMEKMLASLNSQQSSLSGLFG